MLKKIKVFLLFAHILTMNITVSTPRWLKLSNFAKTYCNIQGKKKLTSLKTSQSRNISYKTQQHKELLCPICQKIIFTETCPNCHVVGNPNPPCVIL